jgi:hypothetical protein
MRRSTHLLNLALVTLCTYGSSLHADTILFNNTIERGTPWANGTIEVDQSVRYPKTNTATLKFTADKDYGNGGLHFYGTRPHELPMTIGAEDTILEISVYTTDAAMNGVAVRMNTGTVNFDNSTSDSWTIDGVPGQTSLFTPNEWHTIRMDLSRAPEFSATNSQLNSDGISFKVEKAGTTVYIGEIRLTAVK